MDRGILFSGDMVRAILSGKKTQTRRIAKFSKPVNCWGEETVSKTKSPYAVGDRLYVRETWADLAENGGAPDDRYVYRATDPEWQTEQIGFCWRPSIHMPKLAARIWLEVMNVRIERLQDISQSDAIAEGCPPSHPSIDSVSHTFGYKDFSRSVFAQTWDACYGSGAWDNNPWVWVIEFKRIEVKS